MDTTPKGYADLMPQQRIKCAKFLSILGDEEQSVKLTLLIEKSGHNTFKNVWSKLQLLSVDNEATRTYYDALDKAFTLNEPANEATVISKVSFVRRKLGMPPYITGLAQNCIDDFLKLFIVKTEITLTPTRKRDGSMYDKKSKANFVPLFRLNAFRKTV